MENLWYLTSLVHSFSVTCSFILSPVNNISLSEHATHCQLHCWNLRGFPSNFPQMMLQWIFLYSLNKCDHFCSKNWNMNYCSMPGKFLRFWLTLYFLCMGLLFCTPQVVMEISSLSVLDFLISATSVWFEVHHWEFSVITKVLSLFFVVIDHL